jgi:hypothetical protein
MTQRQVIISILISFPLKLKIDRKIKIDNYYNMYEKIKLSKYNNKPMHVEYENDQVKVVANVENDNFLRIFEHFSPNMQFSTPDIMIQDMLEDGDILPTFKNSTLFTNEDFEDIVKSFKNDYNIERKKTRPKSTSAYMRRRSKNKGDNKNKLKAKLLRRGGQKREMLKRTVKKGARKLKRKPNKK